METATITFRHGHHAGTKAMIVAGERRSDLLLHWTRGQDVLDVITYANSTQNSQLTFPGMRLDVFGELYMQFETRRLFGELVVYVAALFILSDSVRYEVEQWKRLLDDHPSEALLVEHLLDVAIRKLPNLVLNELGNELHEFKFTR